MIIRRKHNANFTVVPNGPINDGRLTFEALGLLAYLLSRPDHWQVRLEHLRQRGGTGREKCQALMRGLIECGYVVRERERDPATSRFGSFEYVVYDEPQKAIAGPQTEKPSMEETREIEPLPENGEAGSEGGTGEISPINVGSTDAKAVAGKPVCIVKTERSKPLQEGSASIEAGGKPPSASAKVWKEGLDLLQTLPSKPNRSIIGKWLKRTPSNEGKEKLLAMIGAARHAGTGDPVSYVTAAVNREFPPPPNPKTFDAVIWHRNRDAAIKTSAWSSAWGPPPGKKGCLMPPELITRQLTQALASRRIAA